MPQNFIRLVMRGLPLIVLTVLVVYWKKRTFLEYLMPKLDRELVAWFEAHRPGSVP